MKCSLWCLVLLFLAAVCLPCAASAEVFFASPPPEWAQKDVLEWIIFDVNEADAMLLRCGGENMLVDSGPVPFQEKLRATLEGYDLTHDLKYIFSTHHHDDHIDGIYYLFMNGFTAGELLHGYDEKTVRKADLLNRAVLWAERSNVPVRQVFDGDVLELGGARLEVIQSMAKLSADENGRSLVLKVTFGESSILLCADITNAAQKDLRQSRPAELLSADLVKAPHHALTLFDKDFLETVAPKAVVVTNTSAKADSRLAPQLRVRGIEGFYAGDGAVRAVTDGKDWYISQSLKCFAPAGDAAQ